MPWGCVNGGGQPQQPANIRNSQIWALRAKALYDIDVTRSVRKSHENTAIKELYAEFLRNLCHKAHELLHTTYVKRSIINLIKIVIYN